MSPRRQRGRWQVALLGAALLVVLVGSLLAGVVYAAHRAPPYRRAVDAAFAATAGTIIDASNETGTLLAGTLSHPGGLGRVLLAAQLGQLTQAASAQAQEATSLESPPPDRNAAAIVVDTLRLRARATATISDAIDRLLGLPKGQPVGSHRALGGLGHPVGIPGAQGLLRQAGRELLLADRTYAKLPRQFKADAPESVLPSSAWTTAAAGVLTAPVLEASAPLLAHNPRLAATVRLVITAVETRPLELPLGGGYPITPTRTFDVAVSIRDIGTATSRVLVIISVQPLGTVGRFDSGRASGVVAAGGAVALELPTMPVVPGEHCRVTVRVVRPVTQRSSAGLQWRRTVVVALN